MLGNEITRLESLIHNITFYSSPSINVCQCVIVASDLKHGHSCLRYLRDSPSEVGVYISISVMWLFLTISTRMQLGQHMFTCKGCHWYWVNCRSPHLVKRLSISALHLSSLKDKINSAWSKVNHIHAQILMEPAVFRKV